MKRWMAVALLVCATTAWAADEPAQNKATISVSGGATLEVTAPEDWSLRTIQPGPTLAPTIRLRAETRGEFAGFVLRRYGRRVVHQGKSGGQGGLAHKWQYLIGSADKKVTLQTIESSSELCVYAELSGDRMEGKEAKLGSYNVVATGIIKFGRTIGVVTLLGKSFDDPAYLAGKEFLKSGLVEKKPAANVQP